MPSLQINVVASRTAAKAGCTLVLCWDPFFLCLLGYALGQQAGRVQLICHTQLLDRQRRTLLSHRDPSRCSHCAEAAPLQPLPL